MTLRQSVLDFLFDHHADLYSVDELIRHWEQHTSHSICTSTGELWLDWDRHLFTCMQAANEIMHVTRRVGIFTLWTGFMLTSSQWLKMARQKQLMGQ